MQKFLILLFPSLSFAASIATDSSTGLGKIISIQPNYVSQTTQIPQKSCTDTTTNTPTSQGTTNGKIVGGVMGAGLGAIAGNQVKQGGGGTAIGAVTGALIGGFVGNNVSQQQTTEKTTTTSCTTTYVNQTTQVQQGYLVQYYYNGIINQTVMQNKPVGQYINVSQLGN